MKWITPLSFLVLGEFCADILAENWSITRSPYLAIGALGAYLLANAFWLFALGNGSGLARGAVLFSVASGVIAVALGVVVYKEHVDPHASCGVVLGSRFRSSHLLARMIAGLQFWTVASADPQRGGSASGLMDLTDCHFRATVAWNQEVWQSLLGSFDWESKI